MEIAILIGPFIFLPVLVCFVDLLAVLIRGDQIVNRVVYILAEIVGMVMLPVIYIGLGGDKNDCCSDSAVFSPDHAFSIVVLITFCLIAYFYCSFRGTIATPVIELVVNVLVAVAVILNVFIAMHTNELLTAAVGNFPIICFCFFALRKNHRLIMAALDETGSHQGGGFTSLARRILNLPVLVKFPILFILGLPFLVLVALMLLLFGQKPDSMIRAFTETYKHGFSQLDYQCDNVQCGGHFLCSVAARGDPILVQPLREGERHGGRIICNRQLLVANAFEDIIQQHTPKLHRAIRALYDRVGDIIHKHCHVFENRLVANCIYIGMKPLEWFFLFILYTVDRRPENRIASQYISARHRRQLQNLKRK